MAPRRVILVGPARDFAERLQEGLARVAAVALPEKTRALLRALLQSAERDGAQVSGRIEQDQLPIVLSGVTPAMAIAQADVFAPVLMLMQADSPEEAVKMHAACPLALTVSIFGKESEARELAAQLDAGSVLINDLIVPTADPRVPFGGRRQSGFGVTRGAEGLLEMTAVKVISARRGGSTRHYQPTSVAHADLFQGIIKASHTQGWKARWQGLRQAIAAARKLR
jgi:acyl-CoA reductase-like NAD-dependent aldehyde dehydrogenase